MNHQSILLMLSLIIYVSVWPFGKSQAEPRVLRLEGKEIGNSLLLPLLVDPSRVREIPQNETALLALSETLATDKKALATDDRKSFYAKRIFSSLSLKAAYWLRQPNATDAMVIDAREKALRELISFAPVALKFVKEVDQRQEIQLSLGLSQYVKTPALAVKTLTKVSPRNSSERDLTTYLIALERLKKGDAGGLNHLEASSSRLGKQASITTALVKAKYLSARKENYRTELLFASRLCHELSPALKEAVFQQSLLTWTKSSDFKGQWEPVPFQVNCFQKTASFPAFMEELAIFATNQGHLDKAIAYYQQAVLGAKAEREKAELAMRFVGTHRTAYLRNGRRDAYQTALIDSERMFHALPQGIKMLQLHDELIAGEISLGLKAEPASAQVTNARVVYSRYMETASFSPGARRIRGLWVDLLVKNKENDEAIETLLSLSRGSAGIVRQSYVNRALDLQNKMLAWTDTDPWQLNPSADIRQLARLGQIVDLMASSSQNKSSMQILRAQIAQRLGLTQEARIRFQKTLMTATKPSDQNKIFTTLLLYAVSSSDLPEVERLAEESFIKGFQLSEALPDNKTIKQLYLDTLVTMAENFYTRSEWLKSRAKMDKVIPLLADTALVNRLLYMKVRSFQNESMYTDALATLDIIDASPLHNEVWQEAVLEKATLLLGQANVEGSTLTYERYLAVLPNGDRMNEVRIGLVDLLIAQGRWAEARNHLRTLILNPGSEEEDLNIWGQKLVEVHKNLLDVNFLDQDIDALNKLKFENKSILAQLLHIQLKKSPQLEVDKYFVEQDFTVSSVQDLMAESAYLKAKDYATKNYAALENKLRSPTPVQENEVRGAYDALAKVYLKVCDRPGSAYCTLALGELSQEIDRYKELASTLKSGEQKSLAVEAYLGAEKLALEKQVQDAVRTRSGAAQWLGEQSREDESMWRYIGVGLQKGVGALDLPSLISKDASLHYSQGGAQ